MGREGEVGWGEEQEDHKGRGCFRRKQRSSQKYRRGSRLGLLAPPLPSTFCPRAREGQGLARQGVRRGIMKGRLAQWRKKSKRRARHKGERKEFW